MYLAIRGFKQTYSSLGAKDGRRIVNDGKNGFRQLVEAWQTRRRWVHLLKQDK